MQGTMTSHGRLGIRLLTRPAPISWKIRNTLRWGFIWGWLTTQLAYAFSKITGVPTLLGKLSIRLIKANGEVIDYGVASYRKVTTAFGTFMVDQMQTETSEFGDFKYHDSGVGTTAENAADTAMETTDGESRATGSQTETSALIYKSVGTIPYTTTKAITEHGVFSSAASTTLLDRSVFTAVNVVATDSIAFTYEWTFVAGS